MRGFHELWTLQRNLIPQEGKRDESTGRNDDSGASISVIHPLFWEIKKSIAQNPRAREPSGLQKENAVASERRKASARSQDAWGGHLHSKARHHETPFRALVLSVGAGPCTPGLLV